MIPLEGIKKYVKKVENRESIFIPSKGIKMGLRLFLSVPQREMGLGLEPRETRNTHGVLMDWTTAWVNRICVTCVDVVLGSIAFCDICIYLDIAWIYYVHIKVFMPFEI